MDWESLSKVWVECYEEGGLSPVNLPQIFDFVVSPVLIIGAGAGRNLLFLNENGFTATGIDTSPSMITLAKTRNVEIMLGDGKSLPFKNASFNSVIVSTGVIRTDTIYTDDFEFLLDEIKRVLTPTGKVCASFLRKDEIQNYLFERLRLYGDNSFNNLFSRAETLDEARENFIHHSGIPVNTINFIFEELKTYMHGHHKQLREVVNTLIEKNEDPEDFIKKYTGFGSDDMGVGDLAYLRSRMATRLTLEKFLTLSPYLVSVVVAKNKV